MSYLIIILVLAVALAPLSHFVPTKRQRQIARLREYAAVHGLFVEFRDTPGAKSGPGRSGIGARGDIIYYGRRMPPRRGEPVKSGSWLSGQDGWRSTDLRAAVPAQLLELPGEIIAASVDQSSCGVYWRESAGEEQVEQIRQVLERWSGALLG